MPLNPLLLFRAVLAVVRLAGSYITLTSPNPTPSANERERGIYHSREANGRRDDGGDVMMAVALAGFTKISVHTFDIIDLFAIFCAVADPPARLSYYARPIARPDPSVGATIGSLLMGIGGVLRLFSYRAMGTNFTFEFAIKRDHSLITHGPYSIVRHPGYTAAFMFFIGALLAFIGPGGVFECLDLWSLAFLRFWGVASALVIVHLCYGMMIRMPMEDRALREEFKEKWVAWSREVPYKLVPYVCV